MRHAQASHPASDGYSFHIIHAKHYAHHNTYKRTRHTPSTCIVIAMDAAYPRFRMRMCKAPQVWYAHRYMEQTHISGGRATFSRRGTCSASVLPYVQRRPGTACRHPTNRPTIASLASPGTRRIGATQRPSPTLQHAVGQMKSRSHLDSSLI